MKRWNWFAWIAYPVPANDYRMFSSMKKIEPIRSCTFVRMRFTGMLLSMLWLTTLTLRGQMFTQMFPQHEYSTIATSAYRGRDTVLLFGFGGLIIRSSDGGQSWTDTHPSGRNWNFYKAVSTPRRIFILAEPTVWNLTSLPPGHRSALLSYDPFKESMDTVQIPRLATSDSTSLTIALEYDIFSGGDAVFFYQRSVQRGKSLHRSMDGGRNWIPITLPDSMTSFSDAYFACRSNELIAVGAEFVHDGARRKRISITTDAGGTWRTVSDFELATKVSKGIFDHAGFAWLTDTDIVAFAQNGAMMLSTDAGISWSIQGFPPFRSVTRVFASSAGRVFVLADQRIYRSDDQCQNFIPVFPEHYVSQALISETDAIICTRGSDNIFTSLDGGTSWESTRVNPWFIDAVRMGSDSEGIALLENINEGSRRYYRTADGWEHMESFMEETTLAVEQCRIFPVLGALWYRIEEKVPNEGAVVLRTTNSGMTWEPVLMVGKFPVLYRGQFVRHIPINDSNYIGIMVNSTLIHSSDRGASWKATNVPLFWSNYQLHLDTAGSSVLLVRPDDESRQDSIFISNRDWNTWKSVLQEPDTSEKGFNFAFLSILAAHGDTIAIHAYYERPPLLRFNDIYISRDGGTDWDSYPMATGGDGAIQLFGGIGVSNSVRTASYGSKTTGFHFYRSDDYWKSSILEGTRYSGIESITSGGDRNVFLWGFGSISRNESAGVNAVDVDQNVESFRVFSPYPQPAGSGDILTVPITLSDKDCGAIRVDLYDLLGRHLFETVSYPISLGATKLTFPLNNIRSGVHFLRIQFREQVYVRPILFR